MSDLRALLLSAGIKKAAVIDDAYEDVPLAKDFASDEHNWTQFFDDLNDDDQTAIKTFFSSFDNYRGDQLKDNNEFVATLWKHQSALRSELVAPLFERYKRDKERELAYLARLTECLTSHGIACLPAGRTFEEIAEQVDLIVIDLYLDSAQDDEAMRRSVDGLRKVIEKRMVAPPLVILMSRSSRLDEKRKEFRDSSGLFESAFRIIKKTELADGQKFTRILARLVEHYEDSKRLAAFLHAWKDGLNSASKRTTDLIRTLDLADLAQIRQLLLTEEGEPPGSYLVDVIDLVLQHEIEHESPIIDAALSVNDINSENYPPPYVAGSPDLQALVYRSLFHHDGRLKLRNSENTPVLFGDILRRKPTSIGAQPAAGTGEPTAGPVIESHANTNVSSQLGSHDVFIVMTPACDLQRPSKNQLLLLKGSLAPLTPADWSYKDRSVRTIVFETSSKDRFQITWNLKHIQTIAPEQLRKELASPEGIHVIARLREAPTLELQQKLLSSLGRVGILAPMPATFPVQIEVYVVNPDKKLHRLVIPDLDKHHGVCFVGRKEDEQVQTLVLCEDACEALCEAVQTIGDGIVHTDTKKALQDLASSNDLLVFSKGVDVSELKDSKYREIVRLGPPAEDGKQQRISIALLRRRGDWMEKDALCQQAKRFGLILIVGD